MSKVCQICSKGPKSGHNVSHSVRRTKRRFLPNLTVKKMLDTFTGKVKKVKLCMKCLKTATKV